MNGKSERVSMRLAMLGWGLAALVGVAVGTILKAVLPL